MTELRTLWRPSLLAIVAAVLAAVVLAAVAPPAAADSPGPPVLASTTSRTYRELGMAGVAFMVGGALLFFGQPLRRRIQNKGDGDSGD